MKFYNREQEIAQLRQWEQQAMESAQMTVITGRRRIGKTTLVRKALENRPYVYFFVAKKSETLLCEEFIDTVKLSLNADIAGEYRTFKEVFKYLMILSQARRFTLVIDEFQEFYKINSSVYSDMQNLWDTYKDRSRMNLIVCGSIYSLMKTIFENAGEPLFQRASHRILLKPFTVDVLKQILSEHHPGYTNEDLLAFYMATGGVARYVELMLEAKAFTRTRILDALLAENSFFLDEGRNVIIEEFGRDYTTYFSILSLIASSRTSRTEIESEIGRSVGPQIEKLESEFNLIKRIIPISAKPGTKQIKYAIDDNFLHFWFRFIYKYRSAIEISNIEYVREIVERDYKTYIGRILEKYFREKFILSRQFSAVGSYWDNSNEIDIVAINDDKKCLTIGEVKLNPKQLRMQELEAKAINLSSKYGNYKVDFVGLSIEDM
ncbi:MAG: ATP-binding protein [Tannerella sp.]|jgi:AAA+ ATPase superfamily predicted ATPase|nr:ATP-binding protein [Tannerella sp.]